MSIEEFNHSFEQIEQKIDRLVQRVKTSEEENQRLKAESGRAGELENEVNELKSKLDSNSSEQSGLNETISTLQRERDQVRERLSGVLGRLDELLETSEDGAS